MFDINTNQTDIEFELDRKYILKDHKVYRILDDSSHVLDKFFPSKVLKIKQVNDGIYIVTPDIKFNIRYDMTVFNIHSNTN